MKTCNRCKIEKPLDCFHKRSARPCGVASECKECRKEKERRRYLSEKEKVVKRQREYNRRNREKINAKRREYVANNLDKIKRYQSKNKHKFAEYQKARRNSDPAYNLACNIRRRINYAFQVSGYKKNGETAEILGCDWQTLISHLESQFDQGMGWHNMGEWEVDHIKPYAEAKSQADVIRLSHYTNLQPLWRTDNRKKGGRSNFL